MKKVKNIKIGKTVKKENGYYIKLTFMYGVGDGYVVRKIGPFKENQKEFLYDCIETLERMLSVDTKNKDVHNLYDDVIGYFRWFSEEGEKETEGLNIQEELVPDGCKNKQAFLVKYKVQYINDGIKHKCNIKFK